MTRLILAVSALCLCSAVQASVAAQFSDIVDAHWQWYLEQSPESRSYLGDHSASDRWDDVSLAASAARDAQRARFLEQLQAIDVTALEGPDPLNHRMLSRRLEHQRQRHALGLDLMHLTMREGPQQFYSVLQYTPFETERDYRQWLLRLQRLPEALSWHTQVLEEGIRRDRVQAREVMERIPAQIDKVLTETAQDSPFYEPFRQMPPSISAKVARQLRDEAENLILHRVAPAYREFREFFVSSYLPATREQPGIGALPGGEALYRFLARDFTTTDLSPEEIHALGKREVARILGEMEAVRTQLEFEGDLQAFNEFLRSDPRFYYSTAEELLAGYRAIAKRIDPELVKLFGELPRMPYGVKPIPAETAPDTTTAYYMEPASDGQRAGYYYVNLYRPEVRPRYEMEVLSVHEAVPGHHLQIALGMELPDLPAFRKEASITAFVEGWALYAEQLGYQIGLYKDPYSRYGQLSYDMWRAVRLVVDTGVHYFGWTRQEAIDYFMAHAPKTEADIINEIDRYIGWPGQALAYKIGQLKILELRARAQQQLGADFDIRAFHDHLLGAGAIPLDALEQRMDAWLALQR